MPAGEEIALVWGAANHDERRFEDPERFVLTSGADQLDRSCEVRISEGQREEEGVEEEGVGG